MSGGEGTYLLRMPSWRVSSVWKGMLVRSRRLRGNGMQSGAEEKRMTLLARECKFRVVRRRGWAEFVHLNTPSDPVDTWLSRAEVT